MIQRQKVSLGFPGDALLKILLQLVHKDLLVCSFFLALRHGILGAVLRCVLFALFGKRWMCGQKESNQTKHREVDSHGAEDYAPRR